jgi:hypothetical protein
MPGTGLNEAITGGKLAAQVLKIGMQDCDTGRSILEVMS